MVKQIPLTKGQFAIVDDEDYEWLSQWKWTYTIHDGKDSTGYAYRQLVTNEKLTTITMHRFIMNPPDGSYVDHVNGDGLDNRRGNLRIATPSENHYNSKPRKNGTSKYKGVYYYSNYKRWAAEIHHDKKKVFLGYFESELEAALAYNQAASDLHYDFALLNDISSHVEPDIEIRPKKINTSRRHGVHFSAQRQNWQATIQIDKKRIHLGSYLTEEEAIRAREQGELRYLPSTSLHPLHKLRLKT